MFISHSTADREIADAACSRLEADGFRCWLAPRDITAGRKWSEAIIDGLASAKVMVLVLSADANSSEQVEREVERAASRRLPIIPLRIEDVPISKSLEYFISTPHWLDAIEPPLDVHLDRLVGAVRELVPGSPARGGKPKGTLLGVAASDSAAVPAAPLAMRLALVYRRGASADERVLALLEAHLKSLGHAVFIDRHMAIGIGWAQEIERQLRESDAVVPLLSEASIGSEMLAYEVQVAHAAAQQNAGKPRLLPVRVGYEGPLPHEIASVLSRLQYFLWKSSADDRRLVEQVAAALAAPTRQATDGARLEAAGGAVPLDSTFYVVRSTDHEFAAALDRLDATVLVKGARQMGKTSLLARGLQQARAAKGRTAFTDLQRLNASQLESAESFYLALGELLADQLDLDVYPPDHWNPRRAPNINFDRFVRRQVLPKVKGHLVWGIDEVDRLFSCTYGTEVFALFRTWHNERAVDPETPWNRLTLAIAYATEAHLFITDPNQSPFNVGTRISLQDFTLDQLADLNGRYCSPLNAGPEMARLYRLIGGQPFLTRRALYELATRGTGIEELEAKATLEDGPFGDHLRRLLVMLARDKELLEVMRGILRGQPCPTSESFYRLRSGGLIHGTSAHECGLRCQLYDDYLRRHLL